jgi:hypothetical protein
MASPGEIEKLEHPLRRTELNVIVELTNAPLDALAVMNHVKSPEAGAIVLFAGM